MLLPSRYLPRRQERAAMNARRDEGTFWGKAGRGAQFQQVNKRAELGRHAAGDAVVREVPAASMERAAMSARHRESAFGRGAGRGAQVLLQFMLKLDSKERPTAAECAACIKPIAERYARLGEGAVTQRPAEAVR